MSYFVTLKLNPDHKCHTFLVVKLWLAELARGLQEAAALPMLIGLTFDWSYLIFGYRPQNLTLELNPDHKCHTFLVVKWWLAELARVLQEAAALPMLLGLTYDWSYLIFGYRPQDLTLKLNPNHKCHTLLVVKWWLAELARVLQEAAALPMLLGLAFDWSYLPNPEGYDNGYFLTG